MKNKYVFLLIALPLCFFSQIVSAQQNDNINDTAEYGIRLSFDNSITRNNSKWEGWGTSLCWWANRIGYNDNLTRKAADLFSTPKQVWD